MGASRDVGRGEVRPVREDYGISVGSGMWTHNPCSDERWLGGDRRG